MGLQFIKKRKVKEPKIIFREVEKNIEEVTEKPVINVETEINKVAEKKEPAKNKIKKDKKEMITKEQISAIEAAAEGLKPEVKVVKKDRGLIERTESSKIIITEDNRQVLND